MELEFIIRTEFMYEKDEDKIHCAIFEKHINKTIDVSIPIVFLNIQNNIEKFKDSNAFFKRVENISCSIEKINEEGGAKILTKVLVPINHEDYFDNDDFVDMNGEILDEIDYLLNSKE